MEALIEALDLWGGERGRGRPRTLVQERLTLAARLPSASDGLRFDADLTCNVTMYALGENERIRVLARVQNVLVESAHEHARQFALGDHGRAQAELFRALNGLGRCGENAVDDTTVWVALKVNDEDIALERRRELVGQQAQLTGEEHRVRMRRVEQLITEVFKDPLTARVWWFEQNQGRWSDLRAAGEALDQLVFLCVQRSAGVELRPGATTAPDPPEATARVSADPILDAFLSGVSEKQRRALVQRLTDILEAYGRADLVRAPHEGRSYA